MQAQRVNVHIKCQAAALAIAGSTAAAFMVGASPIPISDALVLPFIQMAMAGSLATLFGVRLSAIAPIVTGQTLASSTGVGIASLLKFIPGIGTLAGAFIDAVVAGTFTTALGILYLQN